MLNNCSFEERTKMKALVLNENTFQVETIPQPTITENQVLIQLKYAALNHRDQWIREGQYAKIQLPAILGSDGCGEVIAVANDNDKKWIGKSVIINQNSNWVDNNGL